MESFIPNPVEGKLKQDQTFRYPKFRDEEFMGALALCVKVEFNHKLNCSKMFLKNSYRAGMGLCLCLDQKLTYKTNSYEYIGILCVPDSLVLLVEIGAGNLVSLVLDIIFIAIYSLVTLAV